MLKYIRNFILILLTKIVYFVFSKTPYRLNIIVGKFLGLLFYCFDFRYKYLAYKNIKYIFENYNYKQIITLTKKCYQNLGQNLMEFFLLPRVKYFYKKLVEFTDNDKNLLKNLYKKNKGVIIFSAHFSNWELLGCSLTIEKFPIAVVARKVYIPQLNIIVHQIRKKIGEIVIDRGDKTSIKDLLVAIKNKYCIGVLVDQNIKNIKNIDLPFCGKVSPTPISFVELVIKYEIPAVVMLIVRNKNNKYKIEIAEIEKKLYDNKIELAKYVNNIISKYIYQHPEQWVWIHQKWNYT